MKTLLSNNAINLVEHSVATRHFLDESWRLTPARMAEKLTNGRFQRWRHIRFLENKIAHSVSRGGARLIITMPPRHGKSWLASLFTPAWFLSLWPERNVMLSSHNAVLAERWARAVRDFLRTNQEVLGPLKGGQVITSSVAGSISGSGGDLVIVDDPIKSWAEASSENLRKRQIEWFNSSLYTRAEPGASMIVIMTRWHERDLAGYLEHEHGDSWEVLRIPAIAEENDILGRKEGESLCEDRYDQAALSQIRRNVGHRAWKALYQQRPASECGTVLRREWWRFYSNLPAAFDEVIQSWDLTFKGGDSSDYVVGQVWGRVGADKYLIDQVRGKMDFLQTLKSIRELSEKYPESSRKLIEEKANGSAVIAMLQRAIPGLVVVIPNVGKMARVNDISADIESGNVYLPSQAPWIEEFITESSDFPNAKHDDQVDALAYALKYFRKEKHDARTQCSSRSYL